MDDEHEMHPWIQGLLGGALIGFGSLVAMASTGKIPGISGVFGRLFLAETNDRWWRFVFLMGLIAGSYLMFQFNDFAAIYRVPESRALGVYALAGLLVGFGSRYGGGCTSGHGVCGISMGVRDSMVATLTFMLAGILTVFLFNQLGS